MKLALGTAQFGLDYGISNSKGKPEVSEIKKILKLASENKIDFLDTAHSYGNAEEILGELNAAENFQIITKAAAPRDFIESLNRLHTRSVYGALVHSAREILQPQGGQLMRALYSHKDNGAVKKVGVSVYDVAELEAVLSSFPIDLVQLPMNVLDQRFLKAGVLGKLKDRGIEVHARSAFLQGLLLMDEAKIPKYFDSIREKLKSFRIFQQERGYSPIQSALGVLFNLPEIDKVVVGVNNYMELQDILAALAGPLPSAQSLSRFAISDEKVLNPSFWETK